LSHRRSATLGAALYALACTGPTPPPTTSPADAVGEWELVFYRPGTSPGSVALADSTLGTLRLRHFHSADSALVPFIRQVRPGTLIGVAELDLTPIIGRQVSCYFETAHKLPIVVHGDTTTPVRMGPSVPLAFPGPGDSLWLDFTPGSADCGLHAFVTLRGSQGTGTWTEPTFAGPGLSGRFRMRRH